MPGFLGTPGSQFSTSTLSAYLSLMSVARLGLRVLPLARPVRGGTSMRLRLGYRQTGCKTARIEDRRRYRNVQKSLV